MKKPYILLLAWLALLPLMATSYAGEIFRLAPGVQNQAMGSTGLSYHGSLASGWWNPALLATGPDSGAELMRAEHFEGLLQQNQLSLSLGGKTRTAINITHLAIDKVKLTRLENSADTLSNSNRPIVWKTVTNQDFIITASFARSLSGSTSLGISPKLAYRDLAGNSGYGFGADLGFLWNSGKGFLAAANLRDFFSTQVLWENGTHEVAIPSLDLETAYQMKLFRSDMPLRIALRGEFYAEDRGEASNLQMGPVTADLHAGVMLQPISSLIVMGGYDYDAITAGLGIRWNSLGLDYAFKVSAPDGLGSTQRVSASYRW